jgi:hypothetical protein
MARTRRAPTFAGALAQPIYVDVDQIDRFNEVLSARVPEKIQLLFKYYEIDQSDEQSWVKLTLRLAFDYVPGLQPPPPDYRVLPLLETVRGAIYLQSTICDVPPDGPENRNEHGAEQWPATACHIGGRSCC